MKKFAVALSALVLASGTAYAGGLAEAIEETPPVVVEPMEPTPSLPGWVIPAAIIALLIGVAVASDDDEETVEAGTGVSG